MQYMGGKALIAKELSQVVIREAGQRTTYLMSMRDAAGTRQTPTERLFVHD